MVKPEVRLYGFNDDWKEWRLGNWGATYGGLTGKTKRDFGHGLAQYVPYLNVFSNPVMDQTNLERTPVDTSQNQVKAGDVLFTTSSEVPEEVGMSSVVFEVGENVYLNSFCFGFRPNRKIVPTFWAPMLRGPNVRAQFKTLAQGISRFNISPKRAMDVSVHVPAEEEQEAVGEFFTQMDAAITQSEVRLEKLRQYKQTMLHKMFPSGTSRVPEIRFEGFEGEWTQIELAKVVKRVTAFSTDARLPRIEFEDIISGSGRLNKDPKTKSSAKQGIAFTAGDVLFGKLRPYLKNWMKPEFDGVAVGDFWVLRAAGVDANFLYSLIQTESFQEVANITAGSKMPRSSWEVVSTTLFAIPSTTQEQARVGNFFEALDLAINAEEEKLLKFKNLKVTFLAKMLV